MFNCENTISDIEKIILKVKLFFVYPFLNYFILWLSLPFLLRKEPMVVWCVQSDVTTCHVVDQSCTTKERERERKIKKRKHLWLPGRNRIPSFTSKSRF